MTCQAFGNQIIKQIQCKYMYNSILDNRQSFSNITGPNSIVSESSPLFCLQEMKRKAGMTNPDDDEEDDDDLYNSDDDDDDVGSSADNLTVFCVSSVEYQKMKNILTNDGPPNVSRNRCNSILRVVKSYKVGMCHSK